MLFRVHANLQAALLGGSAAAYAYYQAVTNPLHVCWDLDHTLLLSLTPLHEGRTATAAAGRTPDSYFDQYDDDFPCDGGPNNTRTCWRPGARSALKLVGLFATQHVFTAAQESYTRNILERLDPDETIFTSVIHRDIVPHIEYDPLAAVGKDLRVVPGLGGQLPHRVVLFDDRLYNFEPQPDNGIHVRSYDDVSSRDWELARLCLIAVLALLAPDVRPILRYFWSEEQKKKFDKRE